MLRPFSDLKNYALAARDGEIGKVKELYFDDDSWTVRYIVVDTGGWLSGRKVLLAPYSFGLIDDHSRLIAVHLTRKEIENSPPIEADKPVSRQHEAEWHDYYGYPPYWLGASTAALTGIPAFAPPPLEYHVGSSSEPKRQDGDPHLRSTGEVTGYAIQATDGEVGHVDDFIVDDDGWSIRYLAIAQSRWLGKKVILSPDWIDRVTWDEMQVLISLNRAAIKDAPEWDDSQPITRAFEERLFDYYGRHGYWPLGV